MAAQLIVSHLTKTMPDNSITLQDIDFKLARGARLSILGPSGSGKTTLLRLIAGLEIPDAGDIIFNGRSITALAAHKRNFGLMFQDFALFPHLNVFDNIAFGLKMRKKSNTLIRQRVEALLQLTDLEGFGQRRIDDLSGGERQRVALARTLAPEPGLIMFDEPLSSLDRLLRKNLMEQLIRILSQVKATTIFVTHDHTEAAAAGDILMIMNLGKMEHHSLTEKQMGG
jgi:ABC-type Fe3+/spermidine/putrescine transport system ATPase subunit